MIDLSKLKAGDTVLIEARFAAYDTQGSLHFYGANGCEYLDTWLTPKQAQNTIKEIIPAPFNWDDVKPGMAFNDAHSEDIIWYVGRDLTHKTCRVFSFGNFSYMDYSKSLDKLTRAPEKDIKP